MAPPWKADILHPTGLVEFLARKYSMPSVNLSEFRIESEVIKLVPKSTAMKHLLIPMNLADGTLVVAMSDPANATAMVELRILGPYDIEPVVASEESIRAAIAIYYDIAATD